MMKKGRHVETYQDTKDPGEETVPGGVVHIAIRLGTMYLKKITPDVIDNQGRLSAAIRPKARLTFL